ncbi:MAG TPA: EamA family transporter [Holophaga sp.]|mgnify:FL=1|nr:EamA family transporter [Holophaga sp.]HPS68561.1 EamA family transporter [Holophaga sp.]
MRREADPARGYALAFLSAIILSTTAIFIRHLSEGYRLPSLVLAFWRAGFAAGTLFGIMGIVCPSRLRVARRDLGFLARYGLVLGCFNATWTVAVALTNASLATVLVNGSAAFTAVLGWWFLDERLDWIKLAAVALSLAGCVIVSKAADPAVWRANALGVLTGTGSALCYATYSLMGRRAARRGIWPWTAVAYTFLFSCAFLFLLNLVPGLPGRTSGALLHLGGRAEGWGWLFLLAAGPTVADFGIYNASLRHLPSSVASLVMTSEPVFTAVLAFGLFGERMDGSQLAGSALILGGVAFLRLREGLRTAQPVPETP